MIMEPVVGDHLKLAITKIIQALQNNLKSRDNFAPDGEEGQLLVSMGPNTPPVWGGGLKVETEADDNMTGLWLYDGTTDSLQQVSVGANDSGGVGYRILRIPNS